MVRIDVGPATIYVTGKGIMNAEVVLGASRFPVDISFMIGWTLGQVKEYCWKEEWAMRNVVDIEFP